MKFLLWIGLFMTIKSNGQNVLDFNKKFIESENHWVALKSPKDTSYAYGYIYIDPQAGLTLNYEGAFDILANGLFVPQKKEKTSMVKIRLHPNNVLVAFIPESKFQELKITPHPEWLKFYETDTNSIAHLYRWGYVYNEFGEYKKALNYLNKAEKINPKFKGLAVELAFSYNALSQYSKAEDILEKEILVDSTNAYVNKEYIYTLCKDNKVDAAIKQFEKAKSSIKDKQYDSENCYNILQYFYFKKDHANFDLWYNNLDKLPNKNASMIQFAENMKKLMMQ